MRLEPFPNRIHGWVWGLFLAIIILLLGLQASFQGTNPWAGWREGNELRKPVYAEAVHVDAVFRTQANTWSNMFYVAVGLYAVVLGVYDARRRAQSSSGYLVFTPSMSILFGAACCYLGFGSGLFHASLTYRGQQLDVAAMYSPLVALIALNIGRWWPETGERRTWPLLCALAVIASALLYIYKWSMASGTVLPALILAVVIFGVLDRFQNRTQLAVRWLAVAVVMLVLGVLCRNLDIEGRFFPTGDAWLQGHSFWHLFTSLALMSMYFYYRSERD
jgi:predicted membrane channel-forming protein YqfA (hemolysin III family)